jgi:hypothetical protein
MRRKALALQFWEGDRDQANRVARMIADNEPTFRKDVEFVFVPRFDTTADAETVEYVSKKFPTSVFRTSRRETGWPGGCNAMWCSLANEFLLGKHYRGDWPDVRWALTFESDCVPVHPDWINRLDAEWDLAEADGKKVMGCWMPNGHPMGHLNGNLMISPDFARHHSGILGCPSDRAWDVEFAPIFEPVWRKTGLIANFYRALKVTDAQFEKVYSGDAPPVLIHGVKDSSAEDYARRKLRR